MQPTEPEPSGSGRMEVSENSKQCQTDFTCEDISGLVVTSASYQELMRKFNKINLTYDSLRHDDEKTKYYTGLDSFIKLQILVQYTEPYVDIHHNTTLNAPQQILLTLVKLRLNLDFKDLSFRFGISPTTASVYFQNIIDILYERFKKIIIWPDRDILQKTMPSCFIETFQDKTTVIIDCFEVFIEKPSNLLTAAQCWSNYKHHYTLKFLIGITPQGTICFISEAWGGRASDKHIVENSKFLNNINPGDVILADRGFLINEFVQVLGAQVRTPAFTKGKDQLHPTEIEATRSLAHVRIHVERIIGTIRQKYRILSDTVPITLASSGQKEPVIDKIVTVCCSMVNLCPPIVPL